MRPLSSNPMPVTPPPGVVAVELRPRLCDGRYTISVHHDLRRYRLFPWWAVLTYGIGLPENGVVHARSRDRLLQKCERRIRKDALSQGYPGEPHIMIREA